MKDWNPLRLAPRNGRPVILWIQDEEAPPDPVTVGLWETDVMKSGATGATSGHPRHPSLLRPAYFRVDAAASRS